MAEKKEITLTIGVFSGFMNGDGKLLIQRRKEGGSNIPGKDFYGDYELPGGGLTQEEMERLRKAVLWQHCYAKDLEDLLFPEIVIESPGTILAEALKREALEEEGLTINCHYFDPYYPSAYRAVLVQEKLFKIDLAISVPLGVKEWLGTPTGEIEWADTERIKELSQKPKGEQILSGWGKRMCQMMLWCLTYSCDFRIAASAKIYLAEIQREKGYSPLVRETLSVI